MLDKVEMPVSHLMGYGFHKVGKILIEYEI